MPTTRIKKTITVNPITRNEAEGIMREIAELTLEERSIKTEIDLAVLEIKERHSQRLTDIKAGIKQRADQLQAWSEVATEEFGKHKSLVMECGRLGFRTGTPKLVLLSRSWTWDKVLAAVERILPSFIRNKPEVDKEAILNQRDELAEYLPMVGIKVAQDESFFVEPDLTVIEKQIKQAA
jgi:phage host-nuclease inhibitor protein Gam